MENVESVTPVASHLSSVIFSHLKTLVILSKNLQTRKFAYSSFWLFAIVGFENLIPGPSHFVILPELSINEKLTS